MHPAPESRRWDGGAVLYTVCVCFVSVVVGRDEGIKSHFLIRRGPSWPPSALKWEFVQRCTGTTVFCRAIGQKSSSGQAARHTHTHIFVCPAHAQARMIRVHTHSHTSPPHTPPPTSTMSCQMENPDYLSLQFTRH